MTSSTQLYLQPPKYFGSLTHGDQRYQEPTNCKLTSNHVWCCIYLPAMPVSFPFPLLHPLPFTSPQVTMGPTPSPVRLLVPATGPEAEGTARGMSPPMLGMGWRFRSEPLRQPTVTSYETESSLISLHQIWTIGVNITGEEKAIIVRPPVGLPFHSETMLKKCL